MLIKYKKSVLWRVAKRLSYTEDVRCLKVKRSNPHPESQHRQKQQRHDKCQGNTEPNVSGNKDIAYFALLLQGWKYKRSYAMPSQTTDTAVINFRHVEIVHTLLNTDVNIYCCTVHYGIYILFTHQQMRFLLNLEKFKFT